LAIYMGFLTNATHGDAERARLYDTVLAHSTLTEMWRPLYQIKQDGSSVDADSVGLSFFSLHRDGTTFVGHTGSQAGFRAFLFFNPLTGAGVIAAINTDSDLPSGDESATVQRIRDRALELIR
jgi:hypothetical protein